MIAVPALLGAGIGFGVLLVWRGLVPRPEPLGRVLAALDRPVSDATPAAGGPGIGAVARRLLEASGVEFARRDRSLRLVGRSVERHALDKLVGLVGGGAGGMLLVTGAMVAGMALPGPVAMVAVVAFAAAGFVLPDLALAEEAARRRRAFRHALSAYLDLVNVILAGGGGIETALHAAADAGDGWSFAMIRRSLDRARLTGRSPWDVFADLGRELDISELAELAASVSLAGSHGARIRQSLAAKADTLRGHQVAETEAAAEAATERMTIPVAVLLFGFLVFIAYPAVIQITSVSGASP